MRVLRPAALPARIGGSPTEKKSDVMKEAMALEATDANAIEVRQSHIYEYLYFKKMQTQNSSQNTHHVEKVQSFNLK